MDIQGSTRLIALLGDPVAHSLSPAMHNAAFARLGLDFAYVPLRVPAAGLATVLETMRLCGFGGANVTLPHKTAVIPHLDGLSDTARAIGAVNTIVNESGRLIGTTTDPDGFLEGFRETGRSFAGKTVAILGNGGSARTLAYALLMRDRPARVYLVARDAAKSSRLAAEIAERLGPGAGGPDTPSPFSAPEAVPLSDYASIRDRVDIVVNATPLGMHPDIESSPLRAEDLRPGQVVYDIVYVPERTRLIRDAEARGLATVGGLGMLVHQGLASFALWTGVNPDAAAFYAAARARLAGRAAKTESAEPADPSAPVASVPAAGRGVAEDP